ncbi:MAG: hypothetical protein ACFFDW_10695, partial [Candidatus Thorarchaeota archaeon]
SFTLEVDYQIINENNYQVNISLTYDPVFYFEVLSNIDRIEESTRVEIISGCETIGWPSVLSIEKGITKDQRIAYVYVYEQNATTIPKGEYTFWIGFATNDESYLNPIRCKLFILNNRRIIFYSANDLTFIQISCGGLLYSLFYFVTMVLINNSTFYKKKGKREKKLLL